LNGDIQPLTIERFEHDFSGILSVLWGV